MIITKETTKITLSSLKGLCSVRKRSFPNQRKASSSGFKLTNDTIFIALELGVFIKTIRCYCLVSFPCYLLLYNYYPQPFYLSWNQWQNPRKFFLGVTMQKKVSLGSHVEEYWAKRRLSRSRKKNKIKFLGKN